MRCSTGRIFPGAGPILGAIETTDDRLDCDDRVLRAFAGTQNVISLARTYRPLPLRRQKLPLAVHPHGHVPFRAAHAGLSSLAR